MHYLAPIIFFSNQAVELGEEEPMSQSIQSIPWNYVGAITLILVALLVVGLSHRATIHAAKAQKYNSISHGVMYLLVFAVVIIGVSLLTNIKGVRMNVASGGFSAQTIESAEKNPVDTTLVVQQEATNHSSRESAETKGSNELLDLLTQ